MSFLATRRERCLFPAGKTAVRAHVEGGEFTADDEGSEVDKRNDLKGVTGHTPNLESTGKAAKQTLPEMVTSTSSTSSSDIAEGMSQRAPTRRHTLLGDVLEIRRQHFPSLSVALSDRRVTLDHCRVLHGEEIQQFRFTGQELWADYNEIAAKFAERKAAGGRAKTRPYAREVVFAPVKIVLAEQDEPLRAVLTYEPVYPRRGKLALLRPGQPLAMTYAAVGVINSAIGQAYFRKLLREETGLPRSRDGISKEILAQLPLSHADAPAGQIDVVARLACKAAAIHEAERECGRDFWQLLRPVRERLVCEICVLLCLDEAEAHALLQSVADLVLEDVLRPNLFDRGQELPPLPPVRLLSPAQLRLHESLRLRDEREELAGSDLVELVRLERLLFWQEAIEAGPPASLTVLDGTPEEPASAARSRRAVAGQAA